MVSYTVAQASPTADGDGELMLPSDFSTREQQALQGAFLTSGSTTYAQESFETPNGSPTSVDRTADTTTVCGLECDEEMPASPLPGASTDNKENELPSVVPESAREEFASSMFHEESLSERWRHDGNYHYFSNYSNRCPKCDCWT